MPPRDWFWLGVVIDTAVGSAIFLIVIAANGLMLPPAQQ
jgi:hypothetical protein